MNIIKIKKFFLISLLIVPCSYIFAEDTKISASDEVAVSTNATVTDADIVASISRKINSDKTIASNNVNITSQNGHVTLDGKVETDHEASAIIEITESITGVKDVDTTNFSVNKSTQPFTDTYITAKVKGIFIREKLFGNEKVPIMNINVETKNGIVYLSGNAKNHRQANAAISLARSIDGVKDVQSNVVIQN